MTPGAIALTRMFRGASSLAEVGEGSLRGEEDTGQVERDHLLPEFRVHLTNRGPGDHRAGVVDENVYRGTERQDGGLHRLARSLGVTKVSLDQHCAAPVRFDHARRLRSRLLTRPVMNRHISTCARKGDCGGTPDSGARARDDRALTRQVDLYHVDAFYILVRSGGYSPPSAL